MSNTIPLEGRTRLPNKIQDAIQDSGLIISQILNASRSNEASSFLVGKSYFLYNCTFKSF
uniref:Uncharacterized protein n=1 Tax=Ascaris lumbricoides TaxID=6252 RepID=A0A0M3HQV5_ASCLU